MSEKSPESSTKQTADPLAEQMAEQLTEQLEQMAEQLAQIAEQFAKLALSNATPGKETPPLLAKFLEQVNEATSAAKLPHDVYLRPERVAEYFPDLNADLLKTLRKDGAGPQYYKPRDSRRIYYKLSELVEWVEANKITPGANNAR